MLTHPTHGRLLALGLTGMAKALEEQRRQNDLSALDFEERLALMIDRETIEGENKRLAGRLKVARLRQSAVVEDINMKAPRSLDKALFAKLVAGDWITRHQNLAIIGKTGLGKSWIACALGHKACRDDRSVLYHRVPKLFDALALARGAGSARTAVEDPIARRSPDPRRLGPRPGHARSGARSAGNRRRPAWTWLDDRDDPIADRALARDDPKSDYRRRHPGSACAQRPSPDLEGGKHAKIGCQTIRA